MATHSSILAWKITWAEEPGRLQSRGPQRVRHELVTEPTHTQCIIYNFYCCVNKCLYQNIMTLNKKISTII